MTEKKRATFEERRTHLADLTDEQLYDYFWQLTAQVVDPLLAMGRTHTTPAVERSVLLRMGFSSLEAAPIVDGLIDRHLIGKGAGHVVWKLATAKGVSVLDAGKKLASGEWWDEVAPLFPGGEVS